MTQSNEHPGYSSCRLKARRVVDSMPFELTMGFVVLFNMCLVVVEVDANSTKGEAPPLVRALNHSLVFVYASELIVRFFILRLEMLMDLLSLVDIIVVCMDIFGIFLDSSDYAHTSILRIVRLVKIKRTLRMVHLAPELNLLLRGMYGALKSIFWGTLLAAIVIIFWSILAVEFIHKFNREIYEAGQGFEYCERCPRAYSTVWEASITFIQSILCGDSWGLYTLPIIQKRPHTLWFFLSVYVSINSTVMNLILAVIVDSAQQARVLSTHDIASEKEHNYQAAKKRLRQLCAELDVDHDGLLTYGELSKGFETNPQFNDILEALDIRAKDIPVVYGVMDTDRSGLVSYDEFVDEMYKMQKNDAQSMVIQIRFHVTQVLRELQENVKRATDKMASSIELGMQELPMGVTMQGGEKRECSKLVNGESSKSINGTEAAAAHDQAHVPVSPARQHSELDGASSLMSNVRRDASSPSRLGIPGVATLDVLHNMALKLDHVHTLASTMAGGSDSCTNQRPADTTINNSCSCSCAGDTTSSACAFPYMREL